MISFPKDKEPDLKKFFKTLVFNLRKKTRLQDERAAENRMYLGKDGRAVVLIDKEIEKHQDLLKVLSEIYPESKKYGKRYAEQTLKEAIWSVLGSKKEPKDSWKSGLKTINNKYQITLKMLTVYFPVSGISFKGTKWAFGPATFIKLGNREFKKILDNNFLTTKWSSANLKINCFIEIKIKAADLSSSVNIAKPKADLYIAVLNALSDIAGSSNPGNIFSSYMGVGESLHSSLMVFQGNKIIGISRCLTFSLSGFNPHVLRAYPFIRKFRIIKISKELKKYNNGLFLKRIFPALKWMGKAVCQETSEEIFLYYCLGLESIIFDSKFRGEMMNTLQKRIYRLLFTSGSYLGKSIQSYNNFKYLYEIRSKIVHRGGIEVADNDIFLIRNLVLGCLYKILNNKSSFSRYKTSDQFEKWLSKA